MSSDNSEILIRALEASGSEREAKLARAILGQPAAPAEPAAPAVPAAAAPAAEETAPPGKAPLTAADLGTISQEEAVERMDEVDALLRAGA
jgi:hypothetical protein